VPVNVNYHSLTASLINPLAQINAENTEDNRIIDFRDYRRQLIIGFWRGFHQSGELTLYYGYQFLSDGKFTGRNRVYQGEKVIDDLQTQGKWEFDGNILSLTGISQDKKPKALVLRFELGSGTVLSYQGGTLDKTYQGMKLTKKSE